MSAAPHRSWLVPLAAGALAMITQAALGWRLGADLHTFFGSVVIAALIVSPLSAIARSWLEASLLIAAIIAGIAIGWLLPPSREALSSSMLSQCIVLLLCWTLCVAGASRFFATLFHEPTLGSAVATGLTVAWLTAPVWLGMRAVPIVKFHPLFAMNIVLIDLGLWTEQPFEYRYLFSLGQDVPYLLPASIFPCCLLHGLIGLAFSAAGFRVSKTSGLKSAAKSGKFSS